MGNDISNKTLITILTISIVISVAGTFMSLNKINDLTQSTTGFATSDGTATITIEQDISFDLSVADINWTGYINQSGGCDNATLQTGTNADRDANSVSVCWIGSSETEDFELISLANIAINITMNSTDDADSLFDGTAAMSEFQYQTFPIGGGTVANCGNFTSWTDFTVNGNQDVCNGGNLTTVDDNIGIAIRVIIPVNESQDLKTSTITFTSIPA